MKIYGKKILLISLINLLSSSSFAMNNQNTRINEIYDSCVGFIKCQIVDSTPNILTNNLNNIRANIFIDEVQAMPQQEVYFHSANKIFIHNDKDYLKSYTVIYSINFKNYSHKHIRTIKVPSGEFFEIMTKIYVLVKLNESSKYIEYPLKGSISMVGEDNTYDTYQTTVYISDPNG